MLRFFGTPGITIFLVPVITSLQIKNFQEPHRQVNHRTAHNGKVLVVTMLKHLTDPSIPVIIKPRKLRSY